MGDVDAMDRRLQRESEGVSRATALTVDSLEEVTLLEHWFRTRGEAHGRTAASVRLELGT